jgi:hypothetical protein
MIASATITAKSKRAPTAGRAQSLDIHYLHALESTLTEWAEPADDEAYRDL